MEISRIIYSGDLRTEATHLKSGKTITTDAPTDNNGKGDAFSPTDLLATSLGSCMLTIMGIAASQHGFILGDIEVSIEKHMASAPRRVDKIVVTININEKGLSEKDKKLLEASARACPVAKSLHPDLVQEVHFNYN
ncbi:MAG TPA: OsmC family protein [Flavobacteriales bacterium]|nr:osmotically inducible protein OsmC [Flavobacteriales bacterium]HRE73335.1 OsmC family protein [Flavobacteriales bacterium]HRE97444.1 OsmC family protein [Flavobacteriales bacterium]HRJ35743.1 OsmC family protein [Flavobacteriales bacterium]HRJ40047.1 OsmC family protein [Flavobacteriales bacterium]